MVYSIQKIQKAVKQRISTQDRLYDPVYFPIRLLGAILREGTSETARYWKEWYTEPCYSIIVHTSKGQFTLSDIRSINIRRNGSVWVELNSKEKVQMFTRTHDNNFRPMHANQLKDISIEHQPMLKDVLNKQSDYPALYGLTLICKKVTPKKKGYELKKAVWSKLSEKLLTLAEKFQREMERVKNSTTLEFMEKRENHI